MKLCRKSKSLVVSIVMSWFACSQPASGQKLYWADQELGTIFRSNLDGSQVEPVVNVLPAVLLSLTIDADAGKLYWSEFEPFSERTGEGRIRRSELDGSDVVTLFSAPQKVILSLEIDNLHGHLYWSERVPPMIRRSDLDGNNVEDVPATLSATPAISLDPVGGYLYYLPASGFLFRSRLDGSEPEVLDPLAELAYRRIYHASFEPIGRDLYLGASGEVPEIYGTHWFIFRARPDGSEAVEISRGTEHLLSLQFDRPAGMMYWVERHSYPIQYFIRRAALAGCGAEDVITEGLPHLVDLAIDTAVRPAVDIAVGVCPNDLSRVKQPTTSVAVMGHAALDVLKIDPESIRLERADGGRGEARPLVRGNGVVFEDVGSASQSVCGCGSSQPDGMLDAVFLFSTADLRRLSRSSPDAADGPAQLVMRGRLNDGRSLIGLDCILRIATDGL